MVTRAKPSGAAAVPVIAIGASAGGLEATSRLFDALGPATGMAFIVVQHLDPSHKSLLADLLAIHTAMAVVEAADGAPLMANRVHIIPPGRYLAVEGGVLHLSVPQARHGTRLPFDHLLRSLAQAQGANCAALVLSGTGADGSGGLAALHQAGGLVLAQAPDEAEYPGMPRAALATGLVDHVLALAEMPAVLAQWASERAAMAAPATSSDPVSTLAGLLTSVQEATGHDFHHYKPGTITRRIARRMALLALQADDQAGYLARLQADPAECALLASDLLINVTSFFRDAEVFARLEETIIPALIRDLPAGQALRVWVAGCSSGEEAYSLAMLCFEAITASGRDIRLKLFASDLDPDAIALAREGCYAPDAVEPISPERLAHWFIAEDGHYRVSPALRGQVVFSVQDLLTDPPFSRIDLISCRNLMIYLDTAAQARVIALFHFALKGSGVLVLGTAETIAKADNGFVSLAGAECCFRHASYVRPAGPPLPLRADGPQAKPATQEPPALAIRQASLAELCTRAVLASHTPAAILINRAHECLFSLGPVHRYLRLGPGYASLDLLTVAGPSLRPRLRRAIERVSEAEPRVDGGVARVKGDGGEVRFRISVERLAEAGEELLLVCFAETTPREDPGANLPADLQRIAELERELAASQAELQHAIMEREQTTQEQKAINEEALSINEEFQSTNEELLTSKEELQSLNEELTALNRQLQETLDRHRLASDDLQNVLYSTNVGTMFLDAQLRIRFFTPAIRPLFNVIPGDIGRPLGDLRPIVDDPRLWADAAQVLADGIRLEREVRAPPDAWFIRRIYPYHATASRVEGVVITFTDVTERKAANAALEAAKLEAERANAAKSRFLAAASHDLRQPLQALTLLKDLLGRTVTGPRAIDLVGRFGLTLRALSGMLDALLNINQIEAGAVEPRRSVFPIAEVIDRLRDEAAYMAEARQLRLRIHSNSALVESDPRLLEQMLRNLIGNAIKYTTSGGVLLGCRRRGDTVRIEVWDSGIGIPADQLEAVFEEFHQIGNAARDRRKGVGLGLAIVRRLGALLGHPVAVRSVPGRGSVFSVTVPCHRLAPPTPAPTEAEVQPMAAALAGAEIVVVDDDPDLLDLLGQLLSTEGFTVRAAASAAAALELVGAAAVRPALLLTDHNLPGGANGVQLVAAMRAALHFPLPAIILTGDVSADAATAIAGADCLRLDKPVRPDELLAAIASLRPPAVSVAGSTPPVPPQSPFRLTYVIDDEAQARLSLCELLAAQGLEVEDFASAEDFLAAYRSDAAGCLLVDAHLPGISGVDLLTTLRARGDSLPVIVITGDGDIDLAVRAMRAGATEFIQKPVAGDALVASIARASQLSADLGAGAAARAEAVARVGGLTRRQAEVMTMVLAGAPSKNIAADLGISQRTVETHRAEIMHRMGTRSIPELARKAVLAAI